MSTGAASTRYLLATGALCAAALAVVLPRWFSPTLVDDCRDPYTLAQTELIPGSTPDAAHTIPNRKLRILDVAGEFDNPTLEAFPSRYRILRDYDASNLAERPAARGDNKFEPETAESRALTVLGNEVEIALVRGPKSEFVQVGAYVFISGGRTTGNPTLSRISRLGAELFGGRRPTTLLVTFGVAPRGRIEALEDSLIVWIGSAVAHHQATCGGAE